MAYENKKQNIIIDEKEEQDFNEYFSGKLGHHQVLEMLCKDRQTSLKKLSTSFNYFGNKERIYVVSKKAGVNLKDLKSKKHKEIVDLLSNIKGKTTQHYSLDFSNYNIHFFNFIEREDKEIYGLGRYCPWSYSESYWEGLRQNAIKEAEAA